MNGLIFDIQRNSFVDGPGIRTTVFFKGCNLRCAWCHNPESQSALGEILFYKNKCTGCGRCAHVTAEDEDFICFNDAKSICGKHTSLIDVLREVSRDKLFYASSGGGVTFSGGECMLQIDFLEKLMRECKLLGIHTAVDTAGHVPFEYFERIMPYTDMFLYDVKCIDSQKHKQFTGVSNELILENLEKLLRGGSRVWVRIPVIAEVNGTEEEMTKIRKFLETLGYPERVELLEYHALGNHKYAAMGKQPPMFSAPTEQDMQRLKAIFD